MERNVRDVAIRQSRCEGAARGNLIIDSLFIRFLPWGNDRGEDFQRFRMKHREIEELTDCVRGLHQKRKCRG